MTAQYPGFAHELQ